MRTGFCALLFMHCLNSLTAHAADVRIVSWNMAPALYEAVADRLDDVTDMEAALKPDILVLVEVTGEVELREIVKALGWSQYHAVLTNWSKLSNQASNGIEAAVVSKSPIIKAIEYDASPDGHLEVFTESGEVDGLVSEEELSSAGIPHFGDELAGTDRGTLRVDLENGLTIFPVHLKSNINGDCADFAKVKDKLEDIASPETEEAKAYLRALVGAYENGFSEATEEHINNAKKRERVLAATVRVAKEAIAQQRIVVIAGDFNTGFEPGKHGTKPTDCTLKNYSCRKAPFPASACDDGDGFDDTLGILEGGLVGGDKWNVLSRNLGRTYEDTAFGDFAIDHIAVPIAVADKFAEAECSKRRFGSDHSPLLTTYSSQGAPTSSAGMASSQRPCRVLND